MWKWIGGKLDGHKTTLSGVGAILAGLAMILKEIASGDVSPKDIWDGVLVVIGGFGLLGIGGKAQKLINGLNGGTNAKTK